eukprot:GHUV01050002.1.p1 GENE.GHUV01050002.1~~GHUV01050002.1.p1  ORF type:complete len:255 (+),score=65.07 GHUV01050002.1:46-765(+)
MAGVNRVSSSSSSGNSVRSHSDQNIKASNSHNYPAATLDSPVQINGFRSNLGSARSPRSDSDLRTLDTIRSSAIQISGSSFAWDKDLAVSPAVLHDIRLEVPTGSLVIVVGPVGSGKSSLLNAVLGEMVAVAGRDGSSGRSPVTVAGSVAYTAQVGLQLLRLCLQRVPTALGRQAGHGSLLFLLGVRSTVGVQLKPLYEDILHSVDKGQVASSILAAAAACPCVCRTLGFRMPRCVTTY